MLMCVNVFGLYGMLNALTGTGLATEHGLGWKTLIFIYICVYVYLKCF